ncbi:MAG: hypothetical protein NCW75_03570 [Phycisphaera sp.]|nr:MAG: hypothetical protein NCW75_03570 [Phycisphaera sp.]
MQNRTITAAAALLSIAGLASAQEFFTIPVGQGLADDVSNTGVVSGSSGFGDQYWMWTADGGAMQIGGVSPGSGVGGQGKISSDGLFISGSTYNATEDWHELSRYDVATGEWTGFGPIPDIGTQIDAEVSGGWAISGDGQHVVGLGWTILGTADAHAIQWTEGVGIIDLGSAAVGDSSRANGVNFDGTVVVGWQDGAGRQGSAWVDGVQELIFTDTGASSQEAFDVSDDGVWVSGMGVGNPVVPGNAYRYNTSTDTYEVLPQLATGAARFMAGAAISGDGTMVGGGTWGFGPATFGNAFIWQEGVGTMRMDDFLDSKGITYPDGYVFAFISAISSDGQWIAGWGNDGSPATTQTWVVNLGDDTCAADIDGDGELTLFDFLAFQNLFDAGDLAADFDGDGSLTLFDFLAFQNAFDAGCA